MCWIFYLGFILYWVIDPKKMLARLSSCDPISFNLNIWGSSMFMVLPNIFFSPLSGLWFSKNFEKPLHTYCESWEIVYCFCFGMPFLFVCSVPPQSLNIFYLLHRNIYHIKYRYLFKVNLWSVMRSHKYRKKCHIDTEGFSTQKNQKISQKFA